MPSLTLRHLAAVTLLVGASAACDQSPTGTRGAAAPSLPELAQAKGAVTAAENAAGGYDFTVDPNVAQTYLFGPHGVYVPAHSICDPETSSYGPAVWDKPCTPLARPITIHVDVSEVDGHPRVEFDRALRFVPKPLSDDRHWVVLYLRDDQAVEEPHPARRRHRELEFTIVWQAPDGTLVDESVYDATMRTRVHSLDGTVSRRIKHFSGFLVTTRTAGEDSMQ